MIEVNKKYWFQWHGKWIRGVVTKIKNGVVEWRSDE